MLEQLRTLGEAVGAAWHAVGRDPTRFTALAEAHLRARPRDVRLDDVLSWVASDEGADFPTQVDLEARFGEPPLTVYRGDGYRVDVNLWASSTTEIHQHAFAGAFQVLHGSSLHTRYRFTQRRALGAHLALGDLDLIGLEVLDVGDVRPILPGDGSLHSLFHLDHPSATLVVRTDGDPSALPQLSIDPPGVGVDVAIRDAALSPRARRQAQVAAFLGRTAHPGRDAWLDTTLAGAEPVLAYHLIADVLPRTWLPPDPSWDAVDAALDHWSARARWPEDVGATLRLAAGLRVERLLAARSRALLTDPRDRLCVGLLACAPDRAAIDAVLSARYPASTPRRELLRFLNAGLRVRDPVDRTRTALGLHEQAVDVLKRLVADDPTPDLLRAQLARDHGAAWVAQHEDALRDIERDLRARLPFATLFR